VVTPGGTLSTFGRFFAPQACNTLQHLATLPLQLRIGHGILKTISQHLTE